MSYDRGDRGGGRGPPKIDGMYSLKVDNLTYRTSPETLKRAFEKYGEVGDVYIPRDRYTRESRGFAFVRYYDKRDAEEAMDVMDGKNMDGRELRVQMASIKRNDSSQQRYGRPEPQGGGRYNDRDRGGGGRYGGGGGGGRGYRGGRSPRRRSYSRSRSRSRERKRSYSRSRSRSNSKSRSRSRDNRKSPEQKERSASPEKNGNRSRSHSRTPED